jgi:hypothetical protein
MSKENLHDAVREEFSKLNLDGKAAFLVEAIFSTAGSAINEIGSRLNRLASLVSEPFDEKPGDSNSDAEHGAEKHSDEGKSDDNGEDPGKKSKSSKSGKS